MLIVIGGATGTGKSRLSLDLALRLRMLGVAAEVVNADAMQLYRGMDIGTAKLPPREREGVPHHLLDVLEVTESASVARYQREARAAIEDIQARGAVPLLVGGSGLYISAACFGLEFPGTDPAIRSSLEAELQEQGPGMLFARLREADPVAAGRIGPGNGRRIVRALEVIELTGKPFSATLPGQERPWRPHVMVLAEQPRDLLVPRLDARAEDMWCAGLVAETERLAEAGLRPGTTAGQAIGYAQALAQLRGEMTQREAIAETQRLTRRYARRQASWFRRYEALRLDAGDPRSVERILRAAQGTPAAP